MISPKLLIILALICHQFCNAISAEDSSNDSKIHKNGELNGGIRLYDHCPKEGICKSYDPIKTQKCQEREDKVAEEKATFNAKFQKGEINFDIAKMDGVETKIFSTFLASHENEKQLLDVFKYLTQMKETPICVTHITVESLVNLVGQTEAEAKKALFSESVKDSARQSRELLEKQVKEGNNAPGDAYLFGPEGVVEIFIKEDGYKCAKSLLEPKGVVLFIQSIVEALEQNSGQKQTFVERMDSVIKYLDEQPNEEDHQKPEEAHSHGLKAEWQKTLKTLEEKGVKEDLKDFAVWLLRPSHIDGMVQIILFITGLESTVDVSLLALQLLGIDKLFTKAIEKIGIDLEVATGIDSQVVMWAFGPNGVLPLFIRYGQSESEEEEDEYLQLVDKAGRKHKMMKRAVGEEIEFMKKIIVELIEHKGRPMHELMDNLLGNFKKMEKAIQQSWDAHIVRWEQRWTFIKGQMNAKAIRADLKKFAVWFVTPDRVNDLIQLILTATSLDTPTYLVLSVLEMFGISELVEKELNLIDRKVEFSNFAKRHPRGERAIEFMIGKDGVVPLFIKSGQLSAEEWKEDKNEYAADLIKLVGTVLIKHKSPGILMASLFDYFLDTVQSQGFYLQVIQKWNEWTENHHKKLQNAGKVSTTASEEDLDGEWNHNDDRFNLSFCCLIFEWGGKRKTAAQMEAEKKIKEHPKIAAKIMEKKQSKCGAAPKSEGNICVVHSVDGWKEEEEEIKGKELKGTMETEGSIKKQNSKGNSQNAQNGAANVVQKQNSIKKQNNLGKGEMKAEIIQKQKKLGKGNNNPPNHEAHFEQIKKQKRSEGGHQKDENDGIILNKLPTLKKSNSRGAQKQG